MLTSSISSLTRGSSSAFFESSAIGPRHQLATMGLSSAVTTSASAGAGDQYAGGGRLLQRGAGKVREGNLRAMQEARHQGTTVDGDDPVAARLTDQLELALVGVNAVDDFRGLGHEIFPGC